MARACRRVSVVLKSALNCATSGCVRLYRNIKRLLSRLCCCFCCRRRGRSCSNNQGEPNDDNNENARLEDILSALDIFYEDEVKYKEEELEMEKRKGEEEEVDVVVIEVGDDENDLVVVVPDKTEVVNKEEEDNDGFEII
jgi:hypothetical protein